MTANPQERWDSFLRDLDGREDLGAFVSTEAGAFLTLPETAPDAAPGCAPLPEELAWLEGALPGMRPVRELGRGGMGVVLEVVQHPSMRRAAVKIINPDLRGPRTTRRLDQEAVALGRLDHESIARLYATGACTGPLRGAPWILMEFVEGLPLLDAVEAYGLDIHARARLIMRVADAIACAHGRGVLHLDLTPRNIIVRPDLVPKVLDFGISRLLDDRPPEATLTWITHGFGTLSAMAPEQFEGRSGGACSDVYALGAMLYRALTREHPVDIEGLAFAPAAQRVMHDTPRPLRHLRPDIPRDLETIALTALQKAPRDRYPSAAALRDELRRWLEDKPIQARPAGALSRTWRLARRNRREAILLTLGACAILTVATVAVVQAVDARSAQADAERRLTDLRALSTSLVFDFVDDLERLPGAVEIRAEVLRRTLDHLPRLEPEALRDPEFARELVDAYVKLGVALGHPDFASLGLASAEEPIDYAIALGERSIARLGASAPLARATSGAYLAGFMRSQPPASPDWHTRTLSRARELAALAARLEPGNTDDELHILNIDLYHAHRPRNHSADPGASLDALLDLFPRVRDILPRLASSDDAVDLLTRAATPAGLFARESGRQLEALALQSDALALLDGMASTERDGLRPVVAMRVLSLRADRLFTAADAGHFLPESLPAARSLVEQSKAMHARHPDDATIKRAAMVNAIWLASAVQRAAERDTASDEIHAALPGAIAWAEWSLARLRDRLRDGTAGYPERLDYERRMAETIRSLRAAHARPR